MAGDWIPVSTDLAHKLEVLAIAKRTGRNHYEVAGRLFSFWAWAQKETVDGTIRNVDVTVLSQAIGPDVTFWRAVVAVGWLTDTDDGLVIPHWERWLANGAKSRLSNALRQEAWRKRNGERNALRNGERNANVTVEPSTKALPQYSTEEEDKNKTPSIPRKRGRRISDVISDVPGFDSFWVAYPRRVAKQAALRAWRNLAPHPELVAQIIANVTARRATGDWAARNIDKIPHPATYLNGALWTDEPAAVNGTTPRKGLSDSPSDAEYLERLGPFKWTCAVCAAIHTAGRRVGLEYFNAGTCPGTTAVTA